MADIKWDIPLSLGIIAPKGSGKSTLISNMLLDPNIFRNKYSKVFIYSPTFMGDPVYTEVDIPEEQIFSTIEDKDLQYMIDMKMSEEYMDDNFLIVFDDIISDKHIKSSSILKQLLLNSRHHGNYNEQTGEQAGFTIIYTTQHMKSIPAYARQNMSYVICFKTNNHESIKLLYQEYYASLSYDKFLKIYNYCTSEKYNFIMTDGTNIWKNYDLIKFKDNKNDNDNKIVEDNKIDNNDKNIEK